MISTVGTPTSNALIGTTGNRASASPHGLHMTNTGRAHGHG